jgi:hypothetical protein
MKTYKAAFLILAGEAELENRPRFVAAAPLSSRRRARAGSVIRVRRVESLAPMTMLSQGEH